MSNQTQHEQLISAGWRYDAGSDMYEAPGSATDGTQRMYDEASAWLAYKTGTTPMPPKASEPPPTSTRQADPRRKEPE